MARALERAQIAAARALVVGIDPDAFRQQQRVQRQVGGSKPDELQQHRSAPQHVGALVTARALAHHAHRFTPHGL